MGRLFEAGRKLTFLGLQVGRLFEVGAYSNKYGIRLKLVIKNKTK